MIALAYSESGGVELLLVLETKELKQLLEKDIVASFSNTQVPFGGRVFGVRLTTKLPPELEKEMMDMADALLGKLLLQVAAEEWDERNKN